MPRMTSWRFIIQYDTDWVIRAKVINIPFRIKRIGCISWFSQEQEWVIVVASKCWTVNGPNQVSCSIDFEIQFHIDCRGRIGDCDFVRRYSNSQSVIGTWISCIDLSLRVWTRSAFGISIFVVDSGKAGGLVGWLSTLSTGKCRAQPVNIFWLTSCFDDDVSTLADLNVELVDTSHWSSRLRMKPYSQGDHITFIRFNRYEIICDHSKFMIVDAKFLYGCASSVDQSESMFFTAYKSELS